MLVSSCDRGIRGKGSTNRPLRPQMKQRSNGTDAFCGAPEPNESPGLDQSPALIRASHIRNDAGEGIEREP